ncbi:hypothetical protein SAMN05216562_2548 [Microbulbifer marinus]|uniref:DUF6869 domain-containing protein n=2 Tax=Microbulbifer marinus TaxID=658218 RepID=A0A1H4A4H6_9GAMM|nr:hypothetical protein SAMN05216562_2548 [Microbulbifer marinus]
MWEFESGDPRRDQYEWVEDIEYEFVYEKPNEALDLILTIMNFSQSNAIKEVLAAGPLEQVLAQHGPKIIERVERLAQEDEKFAGLLGGVWKNSMASDVWVRVQNVWDRSGWDGNA